MTLLSRLLSRSVRELVRLACLLALVALGIFVYSIVVPRPLPVMLAMSVGHVIGGAAAACYALAILIDATRGKPRAPTEPPPVEGANESNAAS
jgi:hypothetical protein